MKTYQLFINGQWVDSKSGSTEAVFSPSTNKVIANIQDGNQADAQFALSAAKAAQVDWRRTTGAILLPGAEYKSSTVFKFS